jgi:hypothetical protein
MMEKEILEGDLVLVVNDHEAGWYSVEEIEAVEHWDCYGGGETYHVRYTPAYHIANKDYSIQKTVTRGQIDDHMPVGKGF